MSGKFEIRERERHVDGLLIFNIGNMKLKPRTLMEQ